MPTPITSEYGRLDACVRCGFKPFYIALLLYGLHWSIVIYLNSSYLEKFFSAQTVSILYIVGSLITLVSFLSASQFLNRIGAIRLTVIFTILEITALIGMAFFQSPIIALPLFILHQAIAPLILFILDILMEGLIGTQENSTGGRRGLFLTIGSFTSALATLIMGFLVGGETPHFIFPYVVSALLLIPFLGILLYNFTKYPDPIYQQFKAFDAIKLFWQHHDIRNVFFSHFLLQIFFAWMVIYTPVYLAQEMGYHWELIGLILFTALLAYVLLEYLIGYIADTYIGEKEMMVLGFLIMGVSVSWFVFLDNSSIILWMVAMFITRVGASLVETTTESYFFKHTQDKDASIIGVFRIAQPLGYITGPLLGAFLLLFFPFSFTFVILGLCMVLGMFFAMALHDTK